MGLIPLITAALTAWTEWCKTASIRERRELRTEARQLRHESRKAADTGDTVRLSELQNQLAENARDCAALQPAACPSSGKRD